MSLDTLLQSKQLWRGDAIPAAGPAIPTGFGTLDEQLPGGGWPQSGLIELLPEHAGIGELRLLMPLLARLSRERRWLAWIDPPYLPYAPALAAEGVDLSRVLMVHSRSSADGLWALEQALRMGTCSAVLAWPACLDGKALRRLQLAAESGGTLGFLFRAPAASREPSTAMLRLRLTGCGRYRRAATVPVLDIDILKRRGGWPAGPVTVALAG